MEQFKKIKIRCEEREIDEISENYTILCIKKSSAIGRKVGRKHVI